MMDTHEITEPLTLWAGSHEAGSGKGCAMNVVSWENGDTEITDFPDCSDRALARMVQTVNDYLAIEDGPDQGRLRPADALTVLALAHATVGTSAHGLTAEALHPVYVRVALALARKVVDSDEGSLTLEAVEAWLVDPTPARRHVALSLGQGTFKAAQTRDTTVYADFAAYYATQVLGGASGAYLSHTLQSMMASTPIELRRGVIVEAVGESIALFKQLAPAKVTITPPSTAEVNAALVKMAAVVA